MRDSLCYFLWKRTDYQRKYIDVSLHKSNQRKTTLQNLEVHFIDVGQGDATLIKCGDRSMLIDGGENDKGTLIQNYMNKQGVKSLDYFIVTHPDSDHCGGADVIITKYDIDTIIRDIPLPLPS